jgi:hypothetical protein
MMSLRWTLPLILMSARISYFMAVAFPRPLLFPPPPRPPLDFDMMFTSFLHPLAHPRRSGGSRRTKQQRECKDA